jgi:tetratricopeptide (TPR) repeat protein
VTQHHLFLSYARSDNGPDHDGWVTAFHDRLLQQHRLYSGRELDIFLDTAVIQEGQIWENWIYEHLRASKLFVAFLSPAYLRSPWCKREWEEYLRLEHTLARGDGGIARIYFVAHKDLEKDPSAKSWLAEWQRRHYDFDLSPWFHEGAEALRELDARERLDGLRETIDRIDRRISLRLDEATLAELAGGNILNPYANFVGRVGELRRLHEAMMADKIGVVGALHGLGGQGKSALARQYAHAYAARYAAGGRWELNCEGQTELDKALLPLIGLADLRPPPETAGLTADDARAQTVRHIVNELHDRAQRRIPELRQELMTHPARESVGDATPDIGPDVLLILDNVDHPALLAASQRAALPETKWLHLAVTTRVSPLSFGLAGQLRAIEIDSLPIPDAVALLRRSRPFASPDDEAAATQIATLLGGFTLAVELAGAYLAVHDTVSYAGYAERLAHEGGAAQDVLPGETEVAARIRHREKQIETILRQTLAKLDDAERLVVQIAAYLPPDTIVTDWLRLIVAVDVPSLVPDEMAPGHEDPWIVLLRSLDQRRLLTAVPDTPLGTVRMHRLVAEHLRAMQPAERAGAVRDRAVGLIAYLSADYEQKWRHDPAAHVLFEPMRLWIAFLLADPTPDRRLALSAGVIADADATTGLLSRAVALAERVHTALRSLLDANPNDTQAQRDLSTFLNYLGDFYLLRGQAGDAERVLQSYEESLAIARRLATDNTDSAEAARDLSVSLNKLGDFYLQRGQAGDAERALQSYEEDLAIPRRLAIDNPDSAEAARDQSVSLNKLGDFYRQRGQAGDAERALQSYEEDLAIARRLAIDNPDSAEAARDLSVSLNKTGDFYRQRGQAGDAERALQRYEESLGIARRLATDNPGSAQAARDLSVSLNKLGDYYLQRGQAGDAGRALQCYEESLDTRRRLATDNPGSAQAARDLGASLDRFGDFYLQRGQAGDAERALERYEECLAIARRLATDNPDSAEAARDLSVSLVRMGEFHAQAGNGPAAAAAWAEAFAILDGFVTAGRPMDPAMIAAHQALRSMLSGGSGRRIRWGRIAGTAVIAIVAVAALVLWLR